MSKKVKIKRKTKSRVRKIKRNSEKNVANFSFGQHCSNCDKEWTSYLNERYALERDPLTKNLLPNRTIERLNQMREYCYQCSLEAMNLWRGTQNLTLRPVHQEDAKKEAKKYITIVEKIDKQIKQHEQLAKNQISQSVNDFERQWKNMK